MFSFRIFPSRWVKEIVLVSEGCLVWVSLPIIIFPFLFSLLLTKEGSVKNHFSDSKEPYVWDLHLRRALND